jgi:hypothetical protein
MGKVSLLVLSLFFCCLKVYSQQSLRNVISGAGAIYVGDAVNTKNFNYYYGGNLTYYLDDHFSLIGEFLYLSGEKLEQKQTYIQSTHIITGLNYAQSMGDSKIVYGLYSGLSNLRATSFNLKSTSFKNQIVPNVGAGVGYKLFFHPNFHFFTDVKYLYTATLFNEVGRGEVLFSFGLGGQICLKK